MINIRTLIELLSMSFFFSVDDFESLDAAVAWDLGRPIPSSRELRERREAEARETKREVRFMGQMYSPMTDGGRMYYKERGVKVPFKL